jgi:hypothetical protein
MPSLGSPGHSTSMMRRANGRHMRDAFDLPALIAAIHESGAPAGTESRL